MRIVKEGICRQKKLEIVIRAAPPPSRIFAGGFFRQNAFGLIQEYCTTYKISAAVALILYVVPGAAMSRECIRLRSASWRRGREIAEQARQYLWPHSW